MEKRDIIAGLGVIATAEALAWYGLYPDHLGALTVLLAITGIMINIGWEAGIALKKMLIYLIIISFFWMAIIVANDSTVIIWWQKVIAFVIGFCINLVVLWILYKVYRPLFKKMESE